MTSGDRIAKHTGILMAMELGVRIMDALVTIILARYLSPKGFGLLAFAISFSWLFSILPGFGMGSLVTRNMSRDPEDLSRYVANGLVAKLILAVLTLFLMGCFTSVLHYPAHKTLTVWLAGFLMIFETNVRFMLSFFQAAQRMSTVAVVNLLVRFGWLALSLVVISLKGGIIELLGVRALVTLGGLIGAVVLIHHWLGRIQWALEPRFVWEMLKASFPFALFRLYGQVYTDIDTVMLSVMRGDVLTGWYAAAYKVLRVFTFIPSSFFGALLPALSRYAGGSQTDLVATIRRGSTYLAIIALPIAGGGCVIADQLVMRLYGTAYAGAVPALRILIWSVVFTFLNSVMTASIAAVNQEKKASLYLIIGAVFSAASNLVVVPLFAHLGAAATTLLAEGVIYVLQMRLLKKSLPRLQLWNQMWKPLCATLVMITFACLFRSVGLVVTVLGSAAVYIGSLFLFRAVGMGEWQILTRLLRGRTDFR